MERSKAPTRGFCGAVVRYGGHKAVFNADIMMVGTAAVVRASAPISEKVLDRSAYAYSNATHEMTDFPAAGFWRPDLGVFVVPAEQVHFLRDNSKDRF